MFNELATHAGVWALILRACCCRVKVCKAQSLLCDLVNVGSANLAAEAAHIGEAEIIGNDDEEVGTFGSHVNNKNWKTVSGGVELERREREERKPRRGALHASSDKPRQLMAAAYYYCMLGRQVHILIDNDNSYFYILYHCLLYLVSYY